jgi:hypothetical protein
MTDDWIEHHGKGYPDLPMDTLVQVRFADGLTGCHDTDTVKHWEANWVHGNPKYHADITHYRVVAK